ncbi:pentapeptide repeat-containing protein [Shewanella xiamenensis]|uniref:pentapeptide repeat-containing protein n=1 Tax=Shewanella xiamenensis TaxID=332186 RepID=UPI0035B73E5C
MTTDAKMPMMARVASQGRYFFSQQFIALAESQSQWQDLEFEECEFQDCQFSDSTFRNCKFIDCRFVGCNLSLLKVPLSQFNGVSFEECKLVGIDWTRAAWPRLSFAAPFSFRTCILNDCSFMGLKLDEMVLEGCKAQDVDFREGKFNRANFSYSDFRHSLFGRTELMEADFSEATDYDIDIFNNKIKGAKFSRDEAIRLLNGLDITLVD